MSLRRKWLPEGRYARHVTDLTNVRASGAHVREILEHAGIKPPPRLSKFDRIKQRLMARQAQSQ